LQDIQEHVQLLVEVSELVHPTVAERVVLRDSNDDPVIYTAVSGKGDALCTLDSDFFEPGVVAFCRNHGISILTDVMLLQRLTKMR
jgi:predicted nucleic acid-binding protein